MNQQAKGLTITMLGVLFVVPDALFIRLIDADALTITFWRNLLSGSVIFLWLFAVHGKGAVGQLTGIGRYGLIYALFAAISSILFTQAVLHTSVANAVFIIASLPVFAALFSWLVLGEKLSARMAWTIAFVIAGLAVISSGSLQHDSSTQNRASLTGDLAALAVAATFAVCLTAARAARSRSMIPAIPLAYMGCAVLLLPFCDPFSIPSTDWWLVVLHGGVFIAVSNCLLVLGPRYITTPEVALLILMESVLSPILVWYVIGENPGHTTLIGGAIVLGVLFASNLLALYRAKKKDRAIEPSP